MFLVDVAVIKRQQYGGKSALEASLLKVILVLGQSGKLSFNLFWKFLHLYILKCAVNT